MSFGKHPSSGLSSDGESIRLQKFHGVFKTPEYANSDWLAENSALLKHAAGVDVETTGLDFASQKIIELAIRPFIYREDTGEILVVQEGYSGLQDPGEPLSEEISEITGLTDAMLKAQAIDWSKVQACVQSVDLIIAHNAKFDRPFIDRVVPKSKEKLWACSFAQVDWRAKGFEVQKLGILAMYHGFFVDAHRAMNDVNAMIYLLSLRDQKTEKPYLSELLENSARESVVIYAEGSPFETKDTLKSNGYRWNNEKRTWFRTIYSDELAREVQWLEENIYSRKFTGTIHRIPAQKNFAAPENI
jgi:DNA polymerase-3 subunit epsilon